MKKLLKWAVATFSNPNLRELEQRYKSIEQTNAALREWHKKNPLNYKCY